MENKRIVNTIRELKAIRKGQLISKASNKESVSNDGTLFRIKILNDCIYELQQICRENNMKKRGR